MRNPKKMVRQTPGARRQAKYAASGRAIACVLRDPGALAELDRLVARHGGVTAAIVALLRSSAPRDT